MIHLFVDLNYGTGGKFSGVTTINVCKINYLIDIKFHNGNLYVTDYYGQATLWNLILLMVLVL